MASSATMTLFSLSFASSPSLPSTHTSNGVSFSTPFKGTCSSLKLSSAHSISGFRPLPLHKLSVPPISTSFTVVAEKGYKMKTHKASAKRFRVTGNGKILRRGAGKQHLLGKKNTKRKLRLSKMQIVNRSDYDNVIKALPYLKVNRNAK